VVTKKVFVLGNSSKPNTHNNMGEREREREKFIGRIRDIM